MMKFQNTGHLSVSERLSVVSREIIGEYPKLDDNDIIKIAGLCDVVIDDVSADVIFRRYYYMLLVVKEDKTNFDIIYKDMKKYCDGELENQLNKHLYSDIEKYVNGEIDEFPVISNYYGEE